MAYNIQDIDATDWAAYNSWHVFQYFLNVHVPMPKTAAKCSCAIYGVRKASFTIVYRLKNCKILFVNCLKFYLDLNEVRKISSSHRLELLP
jgi:hypothetical protein